MIYKVTGSKSQARPGSLDISLSANRARASLLPKDVIRFMVRIAARSSIV